MTRLRFLATACCALILSSCTEVTFPEPQPKGVPALMLMPPSLRGEYTVREDSAKVPRIPDRYQESLLVIDPWGYYFTNSEEKDWLDRGVISDSLVIKAYKEYYFVNFKTDSRWVLRLLKPTASGSLEYFTLDLGNEEKEIKLIKSLSSTLDVEKVGDGYDTSYEVDPTRDQLMSIISKGSFTGVVLEMRKKP